MKNKGALIIASLINIIFIIICCGVSIISFDGDPVEFSFFTLCIYGPIMWVVSTMFFNYARDNKTGAWDATIITSPSIAGLFLIALLQIQIDFFMYLLPIFFMICSSTLFLFRMNKLLADVIVVIPLDVKCDTKLGDQNTVRTDSPNTDEESNANSSKTNIASIQSTSTSAFHYSPPDFQKDATLIEKLEYALRYKSITAIRLNLARIEDPNVEKILSLSDEEIIPAVNELIKDITLSNVS